LGEKLPNLVTLLSNDGSLPHPLQRFHFRQLLSAKLLSICAGGVAQWSPHLPEEQKTRVRIPQGYKIYKRLVE
jgi:hypothetical protein